MTYFIYNKSGKRGLHRSINRFRQLNHNYHNVQNINVSKTYIGIKSTLPRLKWYITIIIQHSVRETRHTQRLTLKQSVRNFRLERVILVAAALIVIISSP